MNNNIDPELNIASYYLNHLSSPKITTWHTAGGTINQTTKYLGLNKYNIRTL